MTWGQALLSVAEGGIRDGKILGAGIVIKRRKKKTKTDIVAGMMFPACYLGFRIYLITFGGGSIALYGGTDCMKHVAIRQLAKQEYYSRL